MLTLLGEDEARSVDAPLARDLLPMVDGRRTASELVQRLPHHPDAELHYLVLLLLREGILVPAEEDASAFDPSVADLEATWRRAREDGGVLLAPGEAPAPPDRWVLLCADYLDPRLGALRAELPAEEPVVLARPGAERAWVGPVLALPAGACLACLQDRLRLNLTARGLLHRPTRDTEVEVVPLPPGPAPSTLRLLAAGLDGIGGSRHELRVISLGGSSNPVVHRVQRLPHCPVCGDPTRTVRGAEIRLRSRPVGARTGGGLRVRPPEETLAALEHLVSPLTGVVRHVRAVPVPDAPDVHVFTAGHAHHYGVGGVRALRDDLRDHSGGKGRTRTEARASALCEALERFSAVHRGDEPVVRSRASGLEGTVLLPRVLSCFSDAQYRDREAWNAALAGPFHHVPEPYTDQVIDWARVRAPFREEVAWTPAAALYAGTVDPGARFIGADSNGLAGGNCLEEAVLQGLLEVVERDAVAIWWYNRLRRPGVELDMVADPWPAGMREVHRGLGRALYALDLTHDLGIPVVAAISARTGGGPEEILFGFGAHLDPAIALVRAITEVDQMLPNVLQDPAVRRRRLLPDFAEALDWWETASLERQPHLVPEPSASREEAPRGTLAAAAPGADLLDGIRLVVDRLERAGLRVWLHDLTRPDVGFPTVRVLVPGLRHFWRRLGPGRLYDVPVELGWLPAPRAEDELNPTSIFV